MTLREVQKYKNMYWSIQNKRNILEDEIEELKRKLIGYESLLEENTRLQNRLNEYDNIKELPNLENIELQKKVDIFEKKILYGRIKNIIRDEFGYITNDKYGDIFFHVSEYMNDFLHHSFKGSDVLFNLSITPKGLRATNVKII